MLSGMHTLPALHPHLSVRRCATWQAAPGSRLLTWFVLVAMQLVPASASLVTVPLGDLDAEAGSRWADVADHTYTTTFQNSFQYDNPGTGVSITFDTSSSIFSGTLTATNLKPNFAYQIKLDGGGPEGNPTANENLGLAGRWWEEQWNGSSWVNGHNLNDQPDNPLTHADDYPATLSSNDEAYFAHRDLLYGATDHPLYRHTGYLLLGYFVTDASGNASGVSFALDDSYHVLFRATSGDLGQRVYDPLRDGPLLSTPLSNATSYTSSAYAHPEGNYDIDIFGQWERLPQNDILLLPGAYDVNLRLTEESFHAGAWTTVMASDISFTIVPEPSVLALLPFASALLLMRRGRKPGASSDA
jgi:hypothetical protein